MTDTAKRSPSTFLLVAGGAALALLGAAGGWLFESSRTAVNTDDKAKIEEVVRNYILEHPEILPEAIDRLRAKESRQQLAGVADQIEEPFPGAVLGNPQGKITLVEFSDFACTYCRHSVEDVDALIADNPDLRVVVRELPILSPASADAARMGLAAAEQGRYPAFHKAMYAAGRPSAETIEAAARSAGVDLERAKRFIADPKVNAEIQKNVKLAQQLGFDGTPSWVVGDQLLTGAVGRETLAKALEDARKS